MGCQIKSSCKKLFGMIGTEHYDKTVNNLCNKNPINCEHYVTIFGPSAEDLAKNYKKFMKLNVVAKK